MSKGQDSKKNQKKAPLLTAKEKKAAKIGISNRPKCCLWFEGDLLYRCCRSHGDGWTF